MRIVQTVAGLALRPVLRSVLDLTGTAILGEPAEKLIGALIDRFTSHSGRVSSALADANEQAWKALEVALAGGSWLASADVKDFAAQIDLFLKHTPLGELGSEARFGPACLKELRAARKAGLLTGQVEMTAVLEQAGRFARFSDPTVLVETEGAALAEVGKSLRQAEYQRLAELVELRPATGLPMIVAGARFFFRLKVESSRELFQGLTFTQLQKLSEAQEAGFAALADVFVRHGQRLDQLLELAAKTHAVAMENRQRLERLGDQVHEQGRVMLEVQATLTRLADGSFAIDQAAHVEELGREILSRLDRYGMRQGAVQPRHSFTIRNEDERQAIKALLSRLRELPPDDQRKLPALLNGLGKLFQGSGDFGGAQAIFHEVAESAGAHGEAAAQAEALHNAYRAALEARQWDSALHAIAEASRLDPRRFAPFPLDRFEPQRILGAGGFGAAFLCHDTWLANHAVVVKPLHVAELTQSIDKVFTEAVVLHSLQHEAIIRVRDPGFADQANRARPYIVMDYFDGISLGNWLEQHGALPLPDCLAIASQVADGMCLVHRHGVLHRDLKPDNVLVRKETAGWNVKIIDFGLALNEQTIHTTIESGLHRNTNLSDSVAGTRNYSAPEQLGELRDPVGKYSDVYAFGRLFYAMRFGTWQPDDDDRQSLPEGLRKLLSRSTSQSVAKRPADFGQVVAVLRNYSRPAAAAAAAIIDVQPASVAEPASAAREVLEVLPARPRGSPPRVSAPPPTVRRDPPPPPPNPAQTQSEAPLALPASVDRVLEALATGTQLRFFCPGGGGSPLMASYWRGWIGGERFLKVYLDGKLRSEHVERKGFDIAMTLEPGKHVIEIAQWQDNKEVERVVYTHEFRVGSYEIRFNRPASDFKASSFEVLKSPG